MSESPDAAPASLSGTARDFPVAASWMARAINFWGTPRRLYLNWFRAGYVERSVAMRQGDCNRCGLCCQLVVKCVFLRYEDGLASCGRYHTRPANCSQFPINQSDIDDVNRIAPHAPCGYSFKPPCGSKKDESERFPL